MFGWNNLVGAFAVVLCTFSQIYGGNLGMAILTVSIVVRLALLPLTLRIARHAQVQQKLLFSLKTQIARLEKKYKADRQQLTLERAKLYRENGVKPLDKYSLVGGLVQLVVGAGVYSAIRRNMCSGGRFLWIRDLTQPNALLVLLTGVITLIASVIGQHLPEQDRIISSAIPAIITVIVAWRLSSAVVLYWAASAAINGLQGLILRRSAPSQA
jgi:YidC/Oxa1 family membrane protein insertase